MPSTFHHVAAVTPDLDAVLGLMTGVVGAQPVRPLDVPAASLAKMLGWPAANPGATAAMVGAVPGAVELIAAPDGVDVPVGWVLLSFATRAVDEAERACRDRGLPVSERVTTVGGGVDATGFATEVGGIAFEFVEFLLPAAEDGQ